MRFAEIIFRVGSTVVGWIMAYVYLLVLAVIPLSGCTRQPQDLWLGSLILAGAMALCLFLIPLGRRVSDSSRWLSIPAIILLPFAMLAVLPWLGPVTIGGAPLCGARLDGAAAPGWTAPRRPVGTAPGRRFS